MAGAGHGAAPAAASAGAFPLLPVLAQPEDHRRDNPRQQQGKLHFYIPFKGYRNMAEGCRLKHGMKHFRHNFRRNIISELPTGLPGLQKIKKLSHKFRCWHINLVPTPWI